MFLTGCLEAEKTNVTMKPEVEFTYSNPIPCYEYKMFLSETGNPSSLT
jgi:hypothetical protein